MDIGVRKNVLKNNIELTNYKKILENLNNYFQVDKYRQNLINDKKKDENYKNNICDIIKKFLEEKEYHIKDLSIEDLVIKLSDDMIGFSFLTKYINDKNVEEVNINSWEDIEIFYSDGRFEKISEQFLSKEHALNIVRRMLNVSGSVIDNAKPIVLGYLSKNVRLAVLKDPVVNDDVGICASIRIVNARELKKDDFIKSNTATEEMLTFLITLLRYGVSACISGGTGSGKTTIMDLILKELPIHIRMVTIESGSTELNLTKRDEDGKIINSVINLLTRPSENKSQNIDQDDLLAMALRLHPKLIAMGEMRDKEAFAVQEASITGHVVISTIHANNCKQTPKRIVTLCKKTSDIDNKTLLEYVIEAFPIIVYAKQLEDKSRKITEIMECYLDENDKPIYKTLFRYKTTKNERIDDKTVITGHFEKVNNISDNLIETLIQNGMPDDEIEKLKV